MGYHTDFSGEFAISPPLKSEHAEYLKQFSESRRMGRDIVFVEKAEDSFDKFVRVSAGLPIGKEAGYCVTQQDTGVLDANKPPEGQPGLWCQWIPNEEGTALIWDAAEKFYMYVDWLKYLIEHFFAPWGYTLSGEVTWRGQESEDRGTIHVKDNKVEDVFDTIVSGRPSWEKGGKP